MYTHYSDGEVYGSRFFDWAAIVGAAALVALTFNGLNNLAPRQSTPIVAAAPAHAVAVNADKHHAG